MFQNSFLTTLLNMKSSSVTFQVKQQPVHVTIEQKQKEQKYKTSLYHFTITSCDLFVCICSGALKQVLALLCNREKDVH